MKKSHIVIMVLFFRVGLIGNPSDGFNGKTIALSIKNFWAEVTIVESDKLVSFTFYFMKFSYSFKTNGKIVFSLLRYLPTFLPLM